MLMLANVCIVIVVQLSTETRPFNGALHGIHAPRLVFATGFSFGLPLFPAILYSARTAGVTADDQDFVHQLWAMWTGAAFCFLIVPSIGATYVQSLAEERTLQDGRVFNRLHALDHLYPPARISQLSLSSITKVRAQASKLLKRVKQRAENENLLQRVRESTDDEKHAQEQDLLEFRNRKENKCACCSCLAAALPLQQYGP